MFSLPLTPLLFSSFSRLFLGFFFICALFLDLASTSSDVHKKIGEGYRLVSIEESSNGGLVGLLQVKQKNNIYGPDIPLLQLFVK